jgi:hypothetical protein
MGADPRVGIGRPQSTSKDLAYKGRILMLQWGGGGSFHDLAQSGFRLSFFLVRTIFPLPAEFFFILIVN